MRSDAHAVTSSQDIDLSALDSIPGYIRNSLEAPYLDGFQFYQLIGIDSVDEQFQDPPESSEQLLSQTAYLRDEQPIEVTLPDLDLPGYELWFDAPAGQKDLELMLSDAIPAPDAQRAADGWGGDINRVYNAGEEEAVYVLKYVGDTKQDAEELEAAFREFIDELVADGSYTFVERTDADLLVMIASDPSVGPQLEAAFS